MRFKIERAKVWDTCKEDDGKGSLTIQKGVSEFGNTPFRVSTDDGHRIECTPRSMGYECDADYWMWFIAEIHLTMASVNLSLKLQSGMQAQTLSVDLPWEGIFLRPITFHVTGEECIYNINMVNYSSTTSSLHMYLSIAIQADKGSSINCSSGGGQDNVDRSTGRHTQTRILSVEADQSRGDVGTNQMTSLAEGNTSCESVLLVYLYPACIKYTCPNWVARVLSSISLIIQPPDHTDSSDQSVIDSIHGSPD